MQHTQSKPFILGAEQKIKQVSEGISRQILGYDNTIMMVKVIFKKGAIGYAHQHEHVQTTYVVSGKFEATIGGETLTLQAGDSFYAEPNILHGCICIEDGVLIDVFNPMREDFL